MKRFTLIATLILIAAITLWPSPAHALVEEVLITVGETFINSILELVIAILEFINGLLTQIISWLGTAMNTVLSWTELNYGGPAVYAIWKVFRDICNSLFIVFFILISFSTIFHSVLTSAGAFYYRSALMNVIIAAVLINFSLPIGQTIVWAGNAASATIAGLMSGINISATIATSLSVPQVVRGTSGLSLNSAADTVTPPAKLELVQRISAQNFTGNAKTQFDNCIKYNQYPTSTECAAAAARTQAQINAAAIDQEISRLTRSPSMGSRLKDAWYFWASVAQGGASGALSGGALGAVSGAWSGWTLDPKPKEPAELNAKQKLELIVSLMANNFLLMVLAMTFFWIVVLMLIRFPMIWFLLATSCLAFFSYAVPGSGNLKKWFGDIVGWSIFSPLYLFVLYIGVFVLSQQNALISGMQNANIFAGVFGIFMFYVIAAGIFIGGAGAAWNYAFKLSSSLKSYVGGAADTIGVGEKSNFGITTLARRTGIPSRLEGYRERVKEKYEGRFVKPQQRWEEEVKARAQGGKALGALERKRVSEQRAKNKELGLSSSDLQSSLSSSNKTERVAAAMELLERGDLPANKMQEYVKTAFEIDPAFGRAAQEAVNKKLREKAKEKSFDDAAAAKLAYMATAPESQEKFLRDLKKNQVLEYAALANDPDIKTLIMKIEGSTSPILPADILKQNLSKIDAENFGKIKAEATKQGWAIDAELDLRLDDLLEEKGSYYKLVDGAKGPTRQAIISRLQQVKAAKSAAETEKMSKQAELEVLAQERLEAEREDRARRLAARPPTP